MRATPFTAAARPFRARLGLLSLAAALAPLVGLLGTVAALFTTFRTLGGGGTDAGLLFRGASEALIPTEAALLLAVPLVLCCGLLGAACERATDALEGGARALKLAVLSSAEDDSADSVDEPFEVGKR